MRGKWSPCVRAAIATPRSPGASESPSAPSRTLFNRAKRKGYQVVIVLDGDPLSLFQPDGDELIEDSENEEVNEDGDAELE